MNARTPIRPRRNQRPGRIISEVPRTSLEEERMFVVRLEGMRQVTFLMESEIEAVEEAR